MSKNKTVERRGNDGHLVTHRQCVFVESCTGEPLRPAFDALGNNSANLTSVQEWIPGEIVEVDFDLPGVGLCRYWRVVRVDVDLVELEWII